MDSPVTHPWSLGPGEGDLQLDGEWKFVLAAKSEAPWHVYVYSVKGFPGLLKIGIAKDASKRKEEYYEKLLWTRTLTRRTASMVEALFKHASYRFAYTSPPKWNVGNWTPETAIKSIRQFSKQWDGSGKSEVREMDLTAAVTMLDQITTDLDELPLASVIRRYGIKTFAGAGFTGRETITVSATERW